MSVRIFEELLNKPLLGIENLSNEQLVFKFENGEVYRFFHERDCCETVEIVEIIGDLEDFADIILVEAEEVSEISIEYDYGSKTWTLYKFRSNKGTLVVRWLGESNGYYSESVYFEKVEDGK